MAFITADIKIPEIASAVTVRLYFPTDLPPAVGNKVKGVITLLHGMGNSSSDWMRMSAACRYAADNGYVLIAPDVGNSFYTDMAHGPPWYTILTQLLPAQLNAIFNIPTSREMNHIAGLSMGGYGALRLGLANPTRYAAIGSFSGAVDMATMLASVKTLPQYRPLFTPPFGEALTLSEDADTFKLAEKVAALPREQQPRLWCSCGEQDLEGLVLEQNIAFRQHAEKLGLRYTYAQWAGVHEWNFWDRSLAEFIGHIQNDDYAARKRSDWAAPSATE